MTRPKPTRRDVLRVATGVAGGAAVVGAVGAAAYMVPLLDQPDVSAPPPAGTVDVGAIDDLTGLQHRWMKAVVVANLCYSAGGIGCFRYGGYLGEVAPGRFLDEHMLASLQAGCGNR